MQDDKGDLHADNVKQPGRLITVLFIFGLIAPLLTFLLAVSGLTVETKTALLIALVVVYIFICSWLYKKAKQASLEEMTFINPVQFVPEIEIPVIDQDPLALLSTIDEIKDFFGSTLKTEDAFRLVSARVDQIYPFSSSVLFVPDATTASLNAVTAYGQYPEMLVGLSGDISAGIAGLAFHSAEVEIDEDLSIENEARPNFISDHKAAIALPLLREGAVFAIFQMYLDRRPEKDGADIKLLTSISQRISPLLLGARSFESGISEALADSVTDLPNDRALMLVLENQLAESQRLRNERPLSVIAVDIKGFDEINRAFGHASGDRLLKFAGETLRGALRKMDFLARSVNDEFTIILPTASEKKAAEIISRLTAVFSSRSFQLSEHEEVSLWLNFGTSTFWKDGETAAQLIETARQRKQQIKSEAPAEPLWSKKEYVN